MSDLLWVVAAAGNIDLLFDGMAEFLGMTALVLLVWVFFGWMILKAIFRKW